MRRIGLALLVFGLNAVSTVARGFTIIGTSPEVNAFGGGGWMAALVEYSIPPGEEIVAAKIEGTFGNSEVSNTAPLDIYFGGRLDSESGRLEGSILIATCFSGQPCTSSQEPTPWSYVYNPSEFSVLVPDPEIGGPSGGNRLWIRNHPGDAGGMRLGFTTLTITTVPEPSTGLLVIAGLVGLAGWRRARV
jgi:hypothetical protein